jgi:hypothetical protein
MKKYIWSEYHKENIMNHDLQYNIKYQVQTYIWEIYFSL